MCMFEFNHNSANESYSLKCILFIYLTFYNWRNDTAFSPGLEERTFTSGSFVEV